MTVWLSKQIVLEIHDEKLGKNGEAAHFEHDENNPGCYLGYNFDGTKRMHRRPLL